MGFGCDDTLADLKKIKCSSCGIAGGRISQVTQRMQYSDELPDPFGEMDLVATLPPSKPVTGFVGIALFVVLALLLLAARSVVGV